MRTIKDIPNLESVCTVKKAVSNIQKFLAVVKKPNVVPGTSSDLKYGVGDIVMWDNDAPEEKTVLRFPLSDFSGMEAVHAQDRMDVMHFFDVHSNSEGLLATRLESMLEYLFLDTPVGVFFTVSNSILYKSFAANVLVADMLETGKKNLDELYQKLIFDKLLPPESEHDKK